MSVCNEDFKSQQTVLFGVKLVSICTHTHTHAPITNNLSASQNCNTIFRSYWFSVCVCFDSFTVDLMLWAPLHIYTHTHIRHILFFIHMLQHHHTATGLCDLTHVDSSALSLSLSFFSPFEVVVGREAGPQLIRAWGPGLEGGIVGKPAIFVVESVGTDVGVLGESLISLFPNLVYF